MKRWHKALLGGFAGLAVLGGTGYAFRTPLALAFIHWRSSETVAPNRPVPWRPAPRWSAVPACRSAVQWWAALG